MAQLAAIIGLVILNAVIHRAFRRWQAGRRGVPRGLRVTTYPLHPSPAAHGFRFETTPEHASHVRPAGIDW